MKNYKKKRIKVLVPVVSILVDEIYEFSGIKNEDADKAGYKIE